MTYRSRLVVSVLATVLTIPVLAPAQQPPAASSAQVEQLQKQLADMQKQMADMQKVIDASNLPADQRQSMMGHMGMMQQSWKGMHQQCCMHDGPDPLPEHDGRCESSAVSAGGPAVFDPSDTP